ncbi:MAG: BatA domain-containing protein [Adhaeribacter sp.]
MNFIAPVFLYGLSAIAIPILIHLVELRRAKKILFTNVAFIKEVKNITASHRRLKQLLILLCRIGFVVFLVLCFAQPFLPLKGGVNTNNASKIFIDNSYSMQNEPDIPGSSLLELALNHCKKVVQAVGNAGRFGYFDHSGFSSMYNDYTSPKMLDKLEGINYSSSSKSFSAVLAGLQASSREPYNALVYSDFQKKAFQPSDFKSLDKNQNFYFIHLKGTAEHNVFVDSLVLEDEFIRVNQINKVRVRVRNSGPNNIQNCNVKFFVGKQQVSALSINVPAKETASFVLNFRLENKEPQHCRIVLQDFPVEFDNTYFFTLQASPPVNIIDVAEEKEVPTQRLYTNEPLFRYQSVTPSRFNYTLLNNANLVILNGLNQPSPAFAENLRKYVQEGGQVIFVPGTDAQRDQSAFLRNLGIGSVRMLVAKPDAAKKELAQPEAQHPFFEGIFESGQKRLVMPKSSQVLQWNRSGSDLLKFRDGGKFLSSFQLGNGQVYLFAAPFDDKFSEFANHALFVPVMYKLAIESYRNKQAIAYSLGSSHISYPVLGGGSKEVYKLVKDSLEYVPEQQVRDGRLLFSVPNEMNEPGIYRLVSGKEQLSVMAFNFNKKESDLDFYTAEEIKDLAGNTANVHVLQASDEIAIKKIFSPDNRGTQLWKYCLILCLVFALTEILLIRFM